MKITKHGLCLIILTLFSIQIFSQSNYKITEGINPDLYNGTIYNYGVSGNIKGHQFFEDEIFKIGSITINDTVHNNLLLNYDIYNQKILLKYIHKERTVIISIPKEKVKEFSIQDNRFIVLNKRAWDYSIYELIGKSNHQILLGWEKNLELSDKSEAANYAFTKAKRTNYLYYRSEINEIKNKKDFLSLFIESEAQLIKKYMKQNKIRIKHDSQEKLNALINYCNNI
ncbi:MAG: hypothetical protein C0597_16645 [Marinilabiliales bacterium]|nr:MAG: hypothetical protein C0597_16645 [Marinilabiliales bacterium]